MNPDRRTFLKSALPAGAVPLFHSRRAHAASHDPTVAITPALDQFGYGDVESLEGLMRQQFDANHAFFLALNEDMLLKPFRQRAGQAAPGDDMGGCYDNASEFDLHGTFHGFIPGHSFGQYLSGLARAYAVTGSQPTQAKVQRLVRAFAPTVTSKFYDGYHLPAYTYDKTSCGLIDAHEFAADSNALSVLNAATDAVLPHLPRKAHARSEQYAIPHPDEAYCWDETYTLPENLFLAYRRGAGDRFRDLAIRFLEDDLYFSPLSEGQNVLPGEHAYSHVNAFSSAMQAYLVLGGEKHLRAACNGFDFLTTFTLTQRTSYPNDLSSQIEIALDKPANFAVALRIPAWAGPKTRATVNGNRADADLEPGKFARLTANWKNGDRIEIEFDAETVLEAVDPEHPDVVAPIRGPLAVFRIGETLKESMRREDLLKMNQIARGSDTWQTAIECGTTTFKPFASIGDEQYRLYHQVQSRDASHA